MTGSARTVRSSCGMRALECWHDDGKDSWPPRQELDGLTYGDMRPYLPARERLDWLRRSAEYQGQPFEELAAYYRRLGHDEQARRVLLAQQRERTRRRPWQRRWWGWLQDALVGYGYAPGRALALLAVALAAGWAFFRSLPAAPGQPSRASILQRRHLHREPARPRPWPGDASDWNPQGTGLAMAARPACPGLAAGHHRHRCDYARRKRDERLATLQREIETSSDLGLWSRFDHSIELDLARTCRVGRRCQPCRPCACRSIDRSVTRGRRQPGVLSPRRTADKADPVCLERALPRRRTSPTPRESLRWGGIRTGRTVAARRRRREGRLRRRRSPVCRAGGQPTTG